MPDFPRYQSQRDLSTRQPAFLSTEDRSYQATESLGKLAGQAQDIAAQWQTHTDNIQKTAALANFKTGMLDIQNRAANDPDFNNSNRYYEEIDKLRENSLKGFSSKQSQAEMALELGYQSTAGRIQIENTYRKKIVKVGQASTISLMETANSPEEIAAIAEASVANQLYDPKDAMVLQDKYTKQWRDSQFYNDLNTDLNVAKERLESNDYGYSPKELKTAKDTWKEMNRKAEKEQLENYNVGESKLASSVAEDDINAYSTLDEMVATGEITESYANIVKDSMGQKLQKHGKFDEKKVDALLRQYSKVNSTEDLMNFRERVFIEKPYLDEEKFKTFLAWTTPENEEIAFDQRSEWQRALDWMKDKYKSGKQLVDRSWDYISSLMGNGKKKISPGDRRVYKGMQVEAFVDTDGVMRWKKV